MIQVLIGPPMARTLVTLVLCLAASACGRSELLEDRPELTQADQFPTELPRDCSTPTPHEKPELEVKKERWDRGCISVRFTDDMAQYAPELEAALAAWATPCSWLCFETPHRAESADFHQPGVSLIGHRGVTRPTHPALAVEWSYAAPFPSTTSVWTHQVSFRQRRDAMLSRADFIRAVGWALGLNTRAGVESALDGLHEAPTAADLQSICAVYPRCP